MKCSHYFVLVVLYENLSMFTVNLLEANLIDNLSSSIFNKSDNSFRLLCSIKTLESSAKRIENSFSDAFGKSLM